MIMDYEKKYKEALERAKKLHETCDSQAVVGWCEYIFPELCESEDEKIRKTLKHYLEVRRCQTRSDEEYINCNNFLTWLEKQGKVVNEICKENDASLTNEDERIRKSLIILLQHFCKGYRVPGLNFPVSYKDMLDWVEKQGEQKPVDNVGSKFKVEEGKWYVCTQTFVLRGKIVIIKGQTYQAEKDNVIKGENGCRFIDRHDGKASDYFRSWTIQDAKDGDVLYFNNDISGFHSIGLFKRLASKNEINGGTYRCYARYGGFNEESKLEIAQNNNELHHCGTKAYPATKEQRDTLMKAMTDAGWKFDFEKKELMKIDNEEVNGEDYGIDGLWHAQRILEKTLGIGKEILMLYINKNKI